MTAVVLDHAIERGVERHKLWLSLDELVTAVHCAPPVMCSKVPVLRLEREVTRQRRRRAARQPMSRGRPPADVRCRLVYKQFEEVAVPEPGVAGQAQALGHRDVPVAHQPVGQEVGAGLLSVDAGEVVAGEPLLAVHARGSYRRVPGDDCVQPFTGSAVTGCLLYTSPSPRDRTRSRMPSSA